MTDAREQLIEAAEAAYQKDQERWDRFRSFCVSHLGPSGAEQAEVIIGSCFSGQLNTLPQDQLHLLTHFTLGLPPGYSFSEDQLFMVIEQKFPKLGAP